MNCMPVLEAVEKWCCASDPSSYARLVPCRTCYMDIEEASSWKQGMSGVDFNARLSLPALSRTIDRLGKALSDTTSHFLRFGLDDALGFRL